MGHPASALHDSLNFHSFLTSDVQMTFTENPKWEYWK
jgi:hypothetical protein